MVARIILTGGIATGKSLVSSFFQKLGIFVLDTDNLVRGLLSKQTIKAKLFRYFGSEIFKQQRINRASLAEKVFNDKYALLFLEDLLHPLVRIEVELISHALLKRGYLKPYYLVVVPVYLKNRYPLWQDQIWVVDCSIDQQKQRLLNRGYSVARINGVLKAQEDRTVLLQLADQILSNNELSITALWQQVKSLDRLFKE